MKDYSKGPKSAVRQMRGPGMNLGLKKPRKNTIPKPKPYKPSREMKAALSFGMGSKSGKGKTGSYLPNFEEGGSVPSKPKR